MDFVSEISFSLRNLRKNAGGIIPNDDICVKALFRRAKALVGLSHEPNEVYGVHSKGASIALWQIDTGSIAKGL